MRRFKWAVWRAALAAALLAVTATIATAQTTTVTGTITDPAGDPLSGSCTIQAVGPFSATNGWRVVGAPMVIKFSGGSFTASLSPTDSATPSGQYYKVTCGVPQQVVAGRTVGPSSWGPRYWLVPTNTQALDIGTVEITAPPPSPSWQILWQQMAQNGATTGQAPLWNGSSWQPGYVSGTANWGNIGGSIANQADLKAILNGEASLSGKNTMTGYTDFSAAQMRPPEATFAMPPSSAQVGQVWLFLDAASAGVCSGGGFSLAQCRWSGANWQPIAAGSLSGVTWGQLLSGGTTWEQLLGNP